MVLYFLQIADRHVDGRAQVNFEIDVSFRSSVARLNNYSTRECLPRESPAGCEGSINQLLAEPPVVDYRASRLGDLAVQEIGRDAPVPGG
jgi:hypothetical protein